MQMNEHWAQACHPSVWELDTGGSLGLDVWAAWLTLASFRFLQGTLFPNKATVPKEWH